MVRVRRIGGIATLAFLLCSTPAFAASFTSSQNGNWSSSSTWGGAGVPGSGDTVTITSSHVVTVTGSEIALSVTLDSTAGNKMLVIDPGASLLVELAGGTAIAVNAPSPGSTNIVRINGGTLEASNLGTNLSLTGGTSASKLEFTSLGGTATFADNIVFAGTPANAIIDFGPTSGTVELGGDLGNGGTILNNSASTFLINGTGAQTINGYTFRHFTVSKSGTATLNGPITVTGDLTVSTGVLDDGGNQISLNGAGTSTVGIGSTGVLKLGSAAGATFFPTPLGTTAFNPGSTVVYQSGATQTINDSITYFNLYLSTLGPSVNKILASGALTVTSQLDIWDNGANTTTLILGTGSLDLNGNLAGDGTVSMTSGSMTIAGSFSSSASLSAGTGTVTYDGNGAQSMLGAAYNNLTVNKSGGIATLAAGASAVNLTVSAGTFDLGSNTLTLTGNATISGGTTVNASNATLVLGGTSLQTISSSPALTFATLTLSNASGATFGVTNVTVNNAFNLNGGTLTGNFFIDVLATVNRTTGWVIGTLGMGMNPTPARRFHVGTSASYLPVDADAGSAGTLTIRANEGKTPDRTANNVLDRYWTITSGSVTPIDSITFNYNQSDVVTGDETKYILASYDSGSFTFTLYGDVDDVNNNVTATNLTGYVQDWIIGQPGSLAAASKLAITSVNGGSDPNVSSPFSVVVESQDDAGTPTPVFDPTGISLTVAIGSGTLSGTTTGTISGGSDNTTITGVTYSPAETNVSLSASRTSGDDLTSGMSTPFDVLAAPSTLTVTTLADSGAGSLRDAITTANSAGCTAPCAIEFSVAGEINLLSPLPAITVDDLLIDGYSAPGSLANSNAYGTASNAMLVMAVNGGGSVNVGFDIQAMNVDVTGFAIKNFSNSGVKFSGTNTNSSVSGCHIGTDLSGSTGAGSPTGVHVSGSTGATVGGILPAARNLISGNSTWGIITDTASSVTIAGNYVGTNAGLTGPIANNTGIKICDGCTANLGVSGVGNVVSGNTASGIVLAGDSSAVAAHYIGTAGSGTLAIPNATGIQIDSTAQFNTIGGPSPAHMNYIGGNSQNGILIQGDDNTVDNNLIGIAADGVTPRANGGSGVRIEGTGSRNFVGTSQGNKIAYNVNDGVTVAGTGIGNVVRLGKVAGNVNRGIDLGDDGTTTNDATDADTGANNLQNSPAITDAKYNAGNIDVKLSLNSSGGVNANFFRFDVYKADNSSPAQGVEYLGNNGCVAGNVFANYLFSIPAGTVVTGNNVVATATAYSDAACNTPSEGTSEFSASTRVSGPIHWITGTGNWETSANWNPAIVPTSFDDAYVDNSGTYTVTINSLVNVASVHVGGPTGTQTLIVPTSQSLNLSSGSSSVSSNGILTFGGIGLNAGGGALTVSGTFNWNGGSITGAGGVTIASGATFNIDTVSAHALNAGSITIASGATANWLNGAIGFANGGSIDNFGLFESKVDSSISDIGSGGTFDNGGTFRKATTSGFTTFTGITFNHSGGTVDVQTGTLNLSGGTASAPFTISSGATVLIDDSTYTLNTGANATGSGKIFVNGGTLTVNGSPLVIEHLRLDSGLVDGTGTLKTGLTGGGWEWNGGTMSGGGTSIIENAATLFVSGISNKSLSNRTLTLQSGSTTTINGSGTINMSNGATIANAGTLTDAAGISFNDAGTDGGITNTGIFQRTGGVTTSLTGVDLTNSGTVKVTTGTLNPGNVLNTGGIELNTGTMVVNDGIVDLGTGSDISGSGLLLIAGGTLSQNENADTLPNVQLDSGTLNGSATFDITTLVWNGGTMAGAGTTNIPSGATATLATISAKNLQRTITIAAGGTATVTGNGTLNMSAGGNVLNDGLFDFAVDMTVNDSGSDGGFDNTATFRKSSGTGSLNFSGVDLVNSGTIEIQAGTFNPANVTSSGPVTLTGTGTFLADGGTVAFNAGTDVSGTGLLHISGGTVTADAADTIPNLKLSSGTLNGAAAISVTSLLWEGGTMSGPGTTTIPAGATATLATISAKSLQRAFAIQSGGTANVTGTGTVNMGAGSSIQNDGTLEVTAGMSFNDSGSAGDITNTRTFRSNHAGTTTLTGITLNSSTGSGLIDIPQGALDLADGTNSAQITIGSGASFLVNSDTYTLAAGTSVGGTGTLNLTGGTLNVTGSVSVPGFAQTGGTVDGTGTLTLTNVANWTAGTMQGGGTTSVGSGAFFNFITPSAKALNNRTFSVLSGGTANLTGNDSIVLSNGGNIANAGTILITANSTISDGGLGGNVVNTGTIRKQSATGSTSLNGIGLTNNGGLIDIQSGLIGVSSDTFTQTAGSTLKVWLNGTTAGTGFGQLWSTSSVNLAGTLEVALVGVYQPNGGDTFRVLAAPAHVSDFTQPYTYPVLAGGRTFTDAYDGSGLLLTVVGNADLSISKTAPSNVLVGSAISYTLTVNNGGPDVANSVSVTDVLQTGHTGISASGTGWTCNVVSLTVTCTAPTLTAGTAPAITINATAPVTPQTFTNVANVSSSNDPTGGNNSGSAIVTVDPNQAEVEVFAFSPASPIAQSTAFSFTFNVKNNGPQTASSVSFSAPIPTTLTYSIANPSAGTCNFAANTVSCSLGNILSGVTENVVINLSSTTTAGTHIVTGTANALEADPNPGNNSIGAPVEVTGSTITVTNTNDTGMGSLREALDDASNGTCTLPCLVNFNIASGPFVITPATQLPAVDDQTTVDATTQPGYAGSPIVRLDGANTVVTGFELNGNNSLVKGFSVTGFTWGLDIHGDSNTVQGNWIGLDLAGNAAANGDGIRLSGNTNTIGGNAAGQRNVISGNTGSGVYIEDDGTANVVSGNYIGTDVAGTAARANAVGVSIVDEADDNTIGGATPADANVISGNSGFGIYIEGAGGSFIAGSPSVNLSSGPPASSPADAQASRLRMRRRDAAATAAGTAAVRRIQPNAPGDGIIDNAVIRNNSIGPDATGAPLGTGSAGVIIADDAAGARIENNTITNGIMGVVLAGGQGTALTANSIHSNTGLGIDINGDGPTANDSTDADGGPNGTQNFPTLSSVLLTGGGNISITSTIDSSGSSSTIGSIRLEYFKADVGEGKTSFGSACIAGNSFGVTSSFSAPTVLAGDPIVATATSYSDGACTTVADGTSEFSNVVNAVSCTPPTITPSGPTTFCAGGSVTLDAGGGYTTYLWSNGANTQTINVTASGTFTVQTSLGACTSTSAPVTVTVNPLPTVNITGPTSMCAGGNVTLDAGGGFTSYLWSNGATSQTINVSPGSTQNYTVTVSDGTCSASDTHNVVVTALPSATVTPSGPTTFCAGGSVTLTASSGTSWLWSNGAVSQSINVTASGTFTVQVTSGSCTATSSPTTVTVNPLPVVNITGPNAVCAGGSVTLDAGAGFTSYLWNNGATTQTITVTPSSTTNYTVTVSDGTCSASDTQTVTVNATPSAAPTITTASAVCENSTGNNATFNPATGTSYNWTITNGTITSGQGTPAIVYTAGPSGNVVLQVASTGGSCGPSNATKTVPITATPVVNITGPTTACAGTNVTLDAGAGFSTYLWSTGANTQTITVASNADATYSVTVSNGGCSVTDSHTVTITAAPPAVITAPSAASPNQSGLAASVGVVPGATYVWSINNGTIDSGNGTSAITFTAGSAGLTQLNAIVSLGGCSTSANPHFVFIEGGPPAPSADLTVTKTANPTVAPGASLAYTIDVRNFGPTPATNVVVTDTLPAGTTFVSVSAGPWNCTRTGSTVRCTANDVAIGSSTIAITVTAPQSGVITNTVTVSATTHDPNASNNSASATTTVQTETPTCPFAAPPSLQLPVNGASVSSPVTFVWSAVTNASEYELWIADSLVAVTTSTNVSRELPAGTFSWFVIARFANGCGPVTSASRTVTILESSACANAAPEIRTPAPGSVSSPTTFMWTPVAQAVGYRLWIEAHGTAAEDVGTTTGATSLRVSLPPGPVVAYVDALFSGCRPTRSAPISLTVIEPDPCASRATATPLSPSNNSTINSSSIEFTWTEAAGSDGYRVWYSLDNAPPAVLGVTTTSETSLRATIGRGTVVWYVETLHDGCASTESQTSRFTIPARNECGQGLPTPQAPANNAVVNNGSVLFAWSAVQNAAAYELWVAAGNGAPALFGTTSGTTLTRIVPAGEIEWFVRAIVDRCGPRDSQTFRFTYTPSAACETAERAALVAPLAGATVNAPVRFAWTNAGATKYEVYLIRGNGAPQLVATTAGTSVDNINVAPGRVRWFVRAYSQNCAPLDSEERELVVVPAALACSALVAPVISAPGQISTGVPFLIQWTPVNGATTYQVLIADNANFVNASISTVTATELPYQGANGTATAILRYVRVRAIDGRCQPATVSPYGPAHVLVILPKTGGVGSAPLGTGSVTFEIELGPQYAGQSFNATPKQAWITVAPSTGVVPAGGTKLVVTANTGDLPVGTSVGSISVTFGSSARVTTNDGPIGFPLSVGLVTPVTPSPSNTPPPDALIIPAVAHADGINSHFQSDVRVSNTSPQLMTYQLTFTPSGDSGITQGQQSTFTIEPGRTIALDDILKGWFGTSGNSAIGTLEIRPLTQTASSTPGSGFLGLPNLATFASSRTFNVTSNGTFGQYIPAIPFANFVGSQRILSLQQIAQSSRYRTNLGIMEGSGEPASLIVRMFGQGGQQLGQFPLQLNGGQHMQLNAFLLGQGVDNLVDGRVEVEVVSEGGKITAYASVLDNQTSDPLLVTPVPVDGAGATKWVVPGVADLVSGFANWQTDMRVFNAGTTDVDATLLFYSQNGGPAKVKTLTVGAGQVLQFDRALASLFDTSNDGGAVHITTASPARLIATARTYNQVGTGTYGQFISAVTPSEAAGVESRPLQLLQVEETERFRSNVGLVEVNGAPVRLEITAVPPDAKFTAVTELFLNANEFRQLGSLLKSMGLSDTHNARVTVRVLDGTGRVTAYVSVIDMLTNDPTYVPAQ